MTNVLQIAESVVHKSAEMAANDPHGIIITVVSVVVVFISLAILFGAYRLIGIIVSSRFVNKDNVETPTGRTEEDHETEAAIGLALHMYMDENCHDHESNVITIKRK